MTQAHSSHGRTLHIVLSTISLLLVHPAGARDDLGGSIAVTTDYIYRGISQTRGNPAIQGGIQLQSPAGWSVGVWSSSVDFGSRFSPSHEIDLHAARSWSLGPDWSAQLGLTHYEYPDDRGASYDYDELLASLSFQQRITASVSWSPNLSRFAAGTLARKRRALSYEVTLLQPLSAHWSLCAGAGHYDLRDLFGTGYWFWNAGVTFNWDALQIDLSRIDTDTTAERLFGYQASGSRWTAALTWRF